MFPVDQRGPGWGRQAPPSPAYPVNFTHPRARGLQLCLLPHPGIQWYDRSGNGRNVSLVGGPTWEGGGLRFSGTGQYATVPYSTGLNFAAPATFVFEFAGTSDATQCLFSVSTGNSAGDLCAIYLGANVAGNIADEIVTIARLAGGVSNAVAYCTPTRTELLDGRRHRIYLVSDGSIWRIFADGVEKTVTTGTGNTNNGLYGPLSGADTIRIAGRRYNGTEALPFNGTLFFAGVVNRAFTPGEVWDDYTRPYDIISAPSINNYAVSDFATVLSGAASVQGIAAMNAAGQVLLSGGAPIQGVAALSAAAQILAFGNAPIVGVAALSATGRILIPGAATVQGVAALSADVRRVLFGQASIQGVGILTADGLIVPADQAGAAIVGVCTMMASGRLVAVGSATIQGVGTMQATARVTLKGGAAMVGVGNMTANGTIKGGTVPLIIVRASGRRDDLRRGGGRA